MLLQCQISLVIVVVIIVMAIAPCDSLVGQPPGDEPAGGALP